jgi:hypothetical protein
MLVPERMPRKYCWRCGLFVVVIEDQDLDEFDRLFAHGVSELTRLGAPVDPSNEDYRTAFRGVYEFYDKLRGDTGIAAEEIALHKAAMFGPPCQTCAKNLRSEGDTHCHDCGARQYWIPKDRLIYIEDDQFDLSHYQDAILFYLAPWSGPASIARKALTRWYVETNCQAVVLWFSDEMKVAEVFARLFGATPHGYGEVCWVKGGKVVEHDVLCRTTNAERLAEHLERRFRLMNVT